MIFDARSHAARLADLLHAEQSALADFLVSLADFDRHRRWEHLGHSSLWSFLHRDLGLSAGAAQYRKTAAELIQRFPELESPLRDGRLCLMTICEVAKVLTRENLGEVLPRFFHRSRREAKEVAVEIKPGAATRREVVATVPARATPLQPVEVDVTADASASSAARSPTSSSIGASLPTFREAVDPLTSDLRRLHVTVSRRFIEKLEKARTARAHARPGATTEDVLEEALDLLLAREEKRREAAADRPSAEPRPCRPDRIPAHVRRAVWKRDGGRCQWPVESGGVCGSTLRVELDHVVPRARGGPATVENLRCLCRFHNQVAAKRDFRAAWMTARVDAPDATGAP